MGTINFVPSNTFPNYGDGGSSRFAITLDQACNPYTLTLSIDGSSGDYEYTIKDTDEATICTDIVSYSGSDIDICSSGTLFPGALYTLIVTKESGKSEHISFQAVDCEILFPVTATYDCHTGLSIICEGVCTSVDIAKGEDTETVPLPLVDPVFLEDGSYTLTVGTNTVDLEVACAPTDLIVIGTCLDLDTPGIYWEICNTINGESYTITIYNTEEAPLLVHTYTYTVPEGAQLHYCNGNSISVFDTPPIEELTDYSITIESTSLNDKDYLGVFNSTISDLTGTFTTVECPSVGNLDELKVTNIRCDSSGILFDVEDTVNDNISQIAYFLSNIDTNPLSSEIENYTGTNRKRTVTIPYQAFKGCINNNWYVTFYTTSNTGYDTYYYSEFVLYIVELFSSCNCLSNCPWAEVCAEGELS